MRNAFESTVLDLPRHMLIQHPHLVHDAHVAVVVAELTLAATRDTIRILAWLKSNAPQTKVVVVANGVPSGGALEISRKDFEQSIERNVDVVFPFDAKVAAQAAKLGKPMAEVAGGKVSTPFNTLSGMVLNHASEEGSAPDVDELLLSHAHRTGKPQGQGHHPVIVEPHLFVFQGEDGVFDVFGQVWLVQFGVIPLWVGDLAVFAML